MEGGIIVAFEGNGKYDRIPPEDWDYPGKGDWKEFRTDCSYALSPYWNGYVICFVPVDADFTKHPPVFGTGFEILKWVDR